MMGKIHLALKNRKFGIKVYWRKVNVQAGFLSNLPQGHVIFVDCDIDNPELFGEFFYDIKDIVDRYSLSVSYIIETDPKGRYSFVSPCIVDWKTALKIHVDLMPYADLNHLKMGLKYGRFAMRFTEKDGKVMRLKDKIFAPCYLHFALPYHQLSYHLMNVMETKFKFKHPIESLTKSLKQDAIFNHDRLRLTVYETFGV